MSWRPSIPKLEELQSNEYDKIGLTTEQTKKILSIENERIRKVNDHLRNLPFQLDYTKYFEEFGNNIKQQGILGIKQLKWNNRDYIDDSKFGVFQYELSLQNKDININEIKDLPNEKSKELKSIISGEELQSIKKGEELQSIKTGEELIKLPSKPKRNRKRKLKSPTPGPQSKKHKKKDNTPVNPKQHLMSILSDKLAQEFVSVSWLNMSSYDPQYNNKYGWTNKEIGEWITKLNLVKEKWKGKEYGIELD